MSKPVKFTDRQAAQQLLNRRARELSALLDQRRADDAYRLSKNVLEWLQEIAEE